jgi:hypothetical protein
MDWNAIGAIGEVAGATGVVVTLLFLIKQLRDNTRSMKAAATASYMQAYSGANGRASDAYRARVVSTALADPSSLTADEAMSFNMMMSERVALYESLCSMYLDGSIHDSHWRLPARTWHRYCRRMPPAQHLRRFCLCTTSVSPSWPTKFVRR